LAEEWVSHITDRSRQPSSNALVTLWTDRDIYQSVGAGGALGASASRRTRFDYSDRRPVNRVFLARGHNAFRLRRFAGRLCRWPAKPALVGKGAPPPTQAPRAQEDGPGDQGQPAEVLIGIDSSGTAALEFRWSWRSKMGSSIRSRTSRRRSGEARAALTDRQHLTDKLNVFPQPRAIPNTLGLSRAHRNNCRQVG